MLTKLNLFAVVFFGFIITSASVSFAFNVAVDAVIVAKKKGCEKYAVKIRELLETFRAADLGGNSPKIMILEPMCH